MRALLAALTLIAPALPDLDVSVDRVLVVGTEASLWVGVSGATDLYDSQPAPGATVVVSLDGAEVARVVTGADGRGVARFRVPSLPAGGHDLRVDSRSDLGAATVTRRVSVVEKAELHLRTDVPEYRPGSTLRWRVTLLHAVDAAALAGVPVEIAVADPRGTEIWRGRVTTGAAGMVAGAIPLADDLLLGRYTLRATAAGAAAEETVRVRAVELPPFFVRIERRPTGAAVDAQLPYGEPVQGTARVTVDGAPVEGPLDPAGRFAFAAAADAQIEATVTDGAGRHVAASARLDGPADDLELAFVPESNRATAGGPLAVTLVTTDGRGHFVPARVHVKVPGVAGRIAAASDGALRLSVAIPASARGALRLEASAVAADGRVARQDADVEIGARALRLSDAVVPAGAPVEIGGSWPAPRGPVIATLLRHGAPLAVAVARVEDGRLHATLVPPRGAFGLATVRVSELDWSPDGRVEPATERAPVYLLPAALDVRIDGQLRHAPGATAELAVTVRDAAGRPTPAGLAASVVDERILALGAPRPDLPTALAAVDGRAAGLAFADLLVRGERVALRAIVESLPASGPDADLHLAAAARVAAERARIARLRAAVVAFLVTDPRPVGTRGPDGRWEFAAPLPELLARAGLPAADPWGRPTDWTYARRLDDRFTFDELAPIIEVERLERLARLRDRSHPPAYLRVDPWGRPLRLLGHGSGVGSGYGYGTVGYGRGGGGRMALASATATGREPAIRERFDETVLWVAGIETDADGRATLAVPLADSITGWQVAVEAVGAGGAVGAARARLETFLPSHVDVDVPAQLTVGDEYTLPVVVANHTERARTLTVVTTAEGALDGGARDAVDVPAGAVAAVHVPVRAIAPGEGRVLVQLDGDAVRRTIRVEPPGVEVRAAHTTAISEGSARIAFDAPANAEGRLRLFRGALDQSRDGLEGLLREPHGCFEQTSSTTYPNLLVLSLLDPSHPDRARALDLVGKGYQRLISYEVKGGGFSWFGEAPANQVLTAYGLLEFTDMAKVYPVDPKLVERTRAWLVGKQRRDGSWAPDASWLHDWSEVQGRVSTTAYVAWALAGSGFKGAALDRARAFLRAHRAALQADPYLLALWAAADPTAVPLVRAKIQREAGGVVLRAGGRTLFYASGRAADVQVTALAATVLSAADARAALRWLWSARSSRHGWGSTQGDVLALRAAALASPAPKPGGTIRVRLDERDLGTLDLGADGVPTIDLVAGAGRHVLALAGDRDLDAELRLAWRSAAPPPAGLEVALDAPDAPTSVGGTVAMRVTVRNPGRAAVAMPTVVVPVPPGFRVAPASLRGLPVARAEDQGSELHLYLTKLDPGAAVELNYRLEAVAACRVAQRPAQAYAYYDPDVRGASAPALLQAR